LNHRVPEAATGPAFPFLDLRAQFASIRDEVMAAVTRIMESQQFVLGEEVRALEEEIRPHVGCEFAIACASGSDALLLALMAIGVGPGDEVIVPPFTFVATAGAVARLGARPVFVDIDPATFNLDPRKLEPAITAKTRAVIPVHLFGLAADMDAIAALAARHGLAVIEDAAQAIGAVYNGRPAGSLGTIGCFSFYPTKNLGGAGDGGLLTTHDAALADKLRLLHVHGSRTRYQYELVGLNSRLDALQAAVLRVKLRHLQEWNQARRRAAAQYRALFAEHQLTNELALPLEPPACVHVYHQFTIRLRRRDGVQSHLQQCGVPTQIYYPHPLHLQPAFAYLGYHPGDMPQSEAAAREVLSLPMYPELSPDQQRRVVEAIAGFVRG